MDDRLLARFLARLIRAAFILLGLMIVMKIIGLTDIAAGLITGASVSAIVVGFAFKDIGENFLAGFMLAFNRPFRVGDVVELEKYRGKVVALNFRNTQIKTFDGKDIYIPNANIIKTPVINYTIDGYQRYDFTFGIDYGSNVDEAIEITMKVLTSIKGILQEERKPSVAIKELGTSSIHLTAYYWLDTFDKNSSALQIQTKAMDRVVDALDKAGFYLPGDVLELKYYKNEGSGGKVIALDE
jgi:small-conductance mechanosensitive channel